MNPSKTFLTILVPMFVGALGDLIIGSFIELNHTVIMGLATITSIILAIRLIPTMSDVYSEKAE